MTVFQCPKCEIRFASRNEVDHHCRTDHPQFHHEYRGNPPRRVPDVRLDRPGPASKGSARG